MLDSDGDTSVEACCEAGSRVTVGLGFRAPELLEAARFALAGFARFLFNDFKAFAASLASLRIRFTCFFACR